MAQALTSGFSSRQIPNPTGGSPCSFHKKWSSPLRRVELDPEPPVKSGRPAPTFRLSRCEPKSAAGHAHGPSDSGTRRFSIGSKDRRVQSPALQANSRLHSSKAASTAWKNCEEELRGPHSACHEAEYRQVWTFFLVPTGSQVCLCHLQPSRGINLCFT